MKTKTIQILGVAAVAALAAGVLAERLGDRSSTNERVGEPALPELQDAVNDVRSVAIEAGGETLTFERSADGWTVAEKGGYAALPDKVRSLVLALRALEVVEEKTADASRFDRLGLDDPSSDGATSKRIVLRGDGGADVASILVGDRRAAGRAVGAMGSRPADMHYVFAGAEGDPALLVSGQIVADTRAASWLDTTLLNISRERFGAMRFTWGDGESLEIVPDPSEEDGLMIVDVPEGEESKGTVALNPARTALAGLRFEDVTRADAIDFGHESLATAESFTEHGLRITVETVELPIGDDPAATRVWARFSAEHAPDASPAASLADDSGAAVDGPDGDGSGEDGAASEAAEGEPADADEPPPAEELVDEAAEIEARLSGWAFALPTWKTKGLRMRAEDVLQEATPPLVPATVPAGDAAVPDGDGAEESAPGDEPAEPPATPPPGASGEPGGGGGGE